MSGRSGTEFRPCRALVEEAAAVVILEGDCLLLLRTAAGHIGEGKWKALGGKLLEGEGPYEGAVREAFEESGLKVSQLELHGVLRFHFEDRVDLEWVIHVFSTRTYEGELRPSAEGILRWFHLDGIPYEELWEDDEHWLPLLLEGGKFRGEFYYNFESLKLLDFSLDVE